AEAREALYRQHVGRVYALCLRRTSDPAQAEELTQDAFVRAWQRRERGVVALLRAVEGVGRVRGQGARGYDGGSCRLGGGGGGGGRGGRGARGRVGGGGGGGGGGGDGETATGWPAASAAPW